MVPRDMVGVVIVHAQLPFHSPLLVDVCDENSSENKIEEIVNELDPKDFIIPQGTCTVVYTVGIEIKNVSM